MKRRGRGEGRVYRPTYIDKASGERRESAVWWIAYSRGGQKLRESSKSEKRGAAVELLRDRLSAIDQGRPVGPDVDKTTFGDLARLLEDSFIVNGRKSLKRLRGALKHLSAVFAGGLARNIDETRIGQYVRHRLNEGAANGTINRELTALKRMFVLGQRAQRVVRRPHIEMLAEATPRQGFVERDQHEAILAALPAAVRPVVAVAYVTGWRVASEILTRQWKHVDLAAGFLRLEPGETKNGKGRMFPLIPELRAVLEAQRTLTDAVERAEGRVVPYVFHRQGAPIVTFRRAWQRAATAAGLPNLIPHDYRRTAVRNLERAGVPRSTAMALVGHQTGAIYSRYAIVDEAMLNEGAAKLAALHEATRNAVRRVVPLNRPKASGER